jgi:hypothetical protein
MSDRNNYSSCCLGIVSFILLIVYITNHLLNPNFLKEEKFTNIATPIMLVLFIFISIFINFQSKLCHNEDSEENQNLI